MFSKFFIDRPIFASVISIVIVLIGAICLPILPVEKTPDITPPTVVVEAFYPGANAEGNRFNESYKVAGGAGWDEINSFFCLSVMRNGYPRATRSSTLGFRCAQDAK